MTGSACCFGLAMAELNLQRWDMLLIRLSELRVSNFVEKLALVGTSALIPMVSYPMRRVYQK